MLPPSNVDGGDSGVPLSQLWDEFQAERTIPIDDYFDEIQRKIESGESILSTVLAPLEDELELEDVDELDLVPPIFANYGIDVDGEHFGDTFLSLDTEWWIALSSRTSRPTRSGASVHGDPLYPWTSMPVGLDRLSR